MPDRELAETQRALMKNWGMRPAAPIEDELNRRLLLETLAERIADLFKNNYNKLLTALYMLDVPESKYREALSRPDLSAKAYALAELVLDRESARVRTWLYYAEQKRRASPVEQLTSDEPCDGDGGAADPG